MNPDSIKRLAAAAGAALLLSACTTSGGGGTPGGGGEGGEGGTMPPDACVTPTECLDLLLCCRSILVNPVFFESCNQVVLQCDACECERVLSGYIECRPLLMDAGTPDPDACMPDAG